MPGHTAEHHAGEGDARLPVANLGRSGARLLLRLEDDHRCAVTLVEAHPVAMRGGPRILQRQQVVGARVMSQCKNASVTVRSYDGAVTVLNDANSRLDGLAQMVVG